ncbi:MAG: hypothetical protein ABIA93_00490, partial [Candidatus Woesearchaeota archaeon]
AVYISSFRALLAMEEYIQERQDYFDSKSQTEGVFKEAFNNGTINGTHMDIMNDSDFQHYLSRVNAKASQMDILVNANISQLQLAQTDPWNLVVSFTLDINITDMRNLATWEFKKDYETKVPIDDIKDPLYTIGSIIPNTIRRFNATPYIDDTADKNDTTEFVRFVSESFYWNNTRAPSVLQRFYGNFSPSPYGIESIVDLIDIAANSECRCYKLSISTIDYIYFSDNRSFPLVCNIQNISAAAEDPYVPWLKLDFNHTLDYRINGSLDFVNCV